MVKVVSICYGWSAKKPGAELSVAGMKLLIRRRDEMHRGL
jgi:hypothetical protein